MEKFWIYRPWREWALVSEEAWQQCGNSYRLLATCCVQEIPMTQIGLALVEVARVCGAGPELDAVELYLRGESAPEVFLEIQLPSPCPAATHSAWQVATWLAQRQGIANNTAAYQALYYELRRALANMLPYGAIGGQPACEAIRATVSWHEVSCAPATGYQQGSPD